MLTSKLGIGTVQFGVNYGISNKHGQTPVEEVAEILNLAKSKGVCYLDTAYAYGNSEEVIGKIGVNGFNIISKYIPSDISLEKQFETSLKRLNAELFYGYMAHRPKDLIVNNKQNWEILSSLKKDGLVKKIGASFNSIDELEQIISNNIMPDIIQVPYNYFDSRFEKYMKELKDRDCEIHTRSTFLQGLFFCDTKELSPYFKDVIPIINELQQVENLAQALLQYSIGKEFIDVVIVGVNNVEQFRNNLEGDNQILPNLHCQISDEIVTPSLWPKK